MIFTAAATYIAGAMGVTSALGVAAINLGVRIVAGAVVSSLIGNRQQTPSDPQPNGSQSPQQTGARFQLPAGTDNKLSVIYGEAYIKSIIVDAKISTDQKTMWYVLALSEVTDNGFFTMGNVNSPTNSNIYWGDKQLVFGDTDKTKVTSWITSGGETDTKVNGSMYVYLYRNGVNAGDNTNIDAVTIMSDSEIEASQRWNGSRYNEVGFAPTMAHTAFAIVKLIYNQDAGIVGLDQFKIKMTNSLTKPGDVILDYLSNVRYGCAIPLAQIDLGSISALNTYSDELITYTPVGGGTATQPRYRINGPVITGQNCLQNLQSLVDACDSWLQWNESVAKWSVIPNRSYLDYTTYDDLFLIDSSAITSGINVSPVDLNSTYNWVEAQFPNNKISDSTDYTFVVLDEEDKNENEPLNKLIMRLDQVNNSVQAKYLATRRLIQSREDLIVNFQMDYSGIQIDAGDVVRVRFPVYGWGPTNDNPDNLDKLFRVEQVQEFKNEDGTLGVSLSLFEYNNQVFENINISDYEPAANTGLTDPTIVGTPIPPTIINENQESGTFDVQCIIPDVGQIIAMEFWYGPTPTIINNNYKLWDTQFNATTPVYPHGATETTTVVGLQPGDYYWSVRALTQSTKSNFSNAYLQEWSPAQPATRKTVSDTASSAVIYENGHKLWAQNTRGKVLSTTYTPAQDGSDGGGKSTNQIEVQFQMNEYTAGSPDGLLAELWAGISLTPDSYGFCVGSNGAIMAAGNYVAFTGELPATVAQPDLKSYYQRVLDTTGSNVITCATNNSRFIVGGAGVLKYSDTGYNSWTNCTIPAAASSVQFYDIIYANSMFVAVGIHSSNGAYICTSSDGITWTQRVNGGAGGFTSVAFNGSSFMAVGYTFSVGTSSNGTTWSVANVSGGSSITLYGVTYTTATNQWVSCGKILSGGQTYSKIFKLNGSNWDNVFTVTSPGTTLYNIAANEYNGYYNLFAVGNYNQVWYSFDGGDTWSQQAGFDNFGGAIWYQVKLYNNSFYFAGDYYSICIPRYDSINIDLSYNTLWYTNRLQAFGSSPNSAYDNTVQPIQDRLTNNVLTSNTFRTGLYAAGLPVEYFLVGGDLKNPTTPSTVYAGRKTIALTEFKG